MYLKKIMLILCSFTFFTIFSMEEENTQPLSPVLKHFSLKEIQKELGLTEKTDLVNIINPETGNTFAMELLAAFDKLIYGGNREDKVSVLDVLKNELKENYTFMNFTLQNQNEQTLTNMFNNFETINKELNLQFPKNLIEKKIVLDLNQFEELKKNSKKEQNITPKLKRKNSNKKLSFQNNEIKIPEETEVVIKQDFIDIIENLQQDKLNYYSMLLDFNLPEKPIEERMVFDSERFAENFKALAMNTTKEEQKIERASSLKQLDTGKKFYKIGGRRSRSSDSINSEKPIFLKNVIIDQNIIQWIYHIKLISEKMSEIINLYNSKILENKKLNINEIKEPASNENLNENSQMNGTELKALKKQHRSATID